MGVQISKRYSSYSHDSFSTNLSISEFSRWQSTQKFLTGILKIPILNLKKKEIQHGQWENVKTCLSQLFFFQSNLF